jgi:GH18 family chitinase
MESKGSNQEPQSSKLEEVSVSSEELTNLISQLQELKVKVEASEASNSRKFELSPIAKSRTGAQEVRKPGTKVLSAESVKY